jgi:hypothetical protein
MCVECINLAQNREQKQALVSTAMSFRFPSKLREFREHILRTVPALWIWFVIARINAIRVGLQLNPE